jgi:hypothetical protein
MYIYTEYMSTVYVYMYLPMALNLFPTGNILFKTARLLVVGRESLGRNIPRIRRSNFRAKVKGSNPTPQSKIVILVHTYIDRWDENGKVERKSPPTLFPQRKLYSLHIY